jgi:hypothetical protein
VHGAWDAGLWGGVLLGCGLHNTRAAQTPCAQHTHNQANRCTCLHVNGLRVINLDAPPFVVCTQRGWIGRYPLHFHKMGDCPACEFIGNAVVNSTQRGIVIHSTHNSKVVRNVVFAARGAHLYVEEGTEVNNTIQVCGSCCAQHASFNACRLYKVPHPVGGASRVTHNLRHIMKKSLACGTHTVFCRVANMPWR